MKNFNTMSNEQFVDFLFGKLVKHVDIEEIDLHDHDDADTARTFQELELSFQQLELF